MVAGQAFSAQLTGWITAPAGVSAFIVRTNGTVESVLVNGQLQNGFPSGPTGCPVVQGGTVTPEIAEQVAITWYWAGQSGAPYFQLDLGTLGSYAPPGCADEEMSDGPAQLDPGYNLVTSTQTDNAGTGTSNALTNYVYGDPVHGLKTEQVVDPSGQDLVTKYSYEGPSGFYDLSSTSLPAGNSTTDTYYNGTDAPTTAADPCVAGSPAVDQGDGLYQRVTPTQIETYVYNLAGQVVANRSSNSDGWTCTSYDSRGRPAEVAYPAFGASPAYTETYNYNNDLGEDPLVTSITKAVSGGTSTTITTSVDLLGRTASFTDANGNTTTTTYNQAGQVTSTGGSFGTFATSYNSDETVASDSYDSQLADTPVYGANDVMTGDDYGDSTGIGEGTGTSLSYGYDIEGRLSSESFYQTSGAVLFGDTETLSQDGDVLTDTEDGPSGQVGAETYTYDSGGAFPRPTAMDRTCLILIPPVATAGPWRRQVSIPTARR